MKVALVYDRVNKWGGAERVLLALNEIFPDAPLFCGVYHPQKAQWAKVFPQVTPSFLNKIPFIKDKHEILSIFMPIAFESFDFSDYDIVISVTSEFAKAIITRPPTVHICYCLTPIRYLYSGYNQYQNSRPGILGKLPFYKYLSKIPLNYAKLVDDAVSQRPDHYVAISNEVKNRIKKHYNKDSALIFPPVEINKFKPSHVSKSSLKSKSKIKKDQYYLVVGRLEPYKKVDLVVNTFNKNDKNLIVVGTGSQKNSLEKIARKNIQFLTNVSDEQLAKLYANAKALIFPQEEDFGIVAVEAQAAGTPVIAYKKAGALDTVIDGQTGVFFDKQTIKCLQDAIVQCEKKTFDSKKLLKNAQRFSKENFQYTILNYIQNVRI